MNNFSKLLAGAVLTFSASAFSLPAVAQSVQSPYVDSACGAWQGNTWVPNGRCSDADRTFKHQYVAGTIVSVTGHLVTVQRSTGQLVIDDQLALNREMTGKVAVGRRILAHGYWRNKVFYATMIQPNTATGKASAMMATPYVDSRCGTWRGNAWQSNGTCTRTVDMYRHQYVAGTITGVTGHLVTIQRSKGTLVIDDQLALNRKMTGTVAVGRRILAHGYWRNKVFYATLIQ